MNNNKYQNVPTRWLLKARSREVKVKHVLVRTCDNYPYYTGEQPTPITLYESMVF